MPKGLEKHDIYIIKQAIIEEEEDRVESESQILMHL